MLVVDVETTGLNPEKHSIVSIGALDFFNPKNQFYEECKIWPGAEIDPLAMKLNGFTEEQVRSESRVSLEFAVKEFIVWADDIKNHGRTLAGENPKFDANFLENSATRYGIKWPFTHRTIDLHTEAYLQRLKKKIEIPLTGYHCSDLKMDKTLVFVGLPEEPMPHNALNGAKYEAEAFSRLLYGKNLLKEFEKFPIPKNL